MKYRVITKADIGKVDYGWLKPNYYFSFANYYNPDRMGFGKLRVLNNDWIAPSSGFPPHFHQNMEIVTIVFEGTLTHKDSLGSIGHIKNGTIQIMSAGSGITHSEYNDSDKEAVTLFQIWIEPNVHNINPRYEEKSFDTTKKNDVIPLITPINNDFSLKIYQEVYISLINLENSDINYNLNNSKNGLFIIPFQNNIKITDINVSLEEKEAIEIIDIEEKSINIKSDTLSSLIVIETTL